VLAHGALLHYTACTIYLSLQEDGRIGDEFMEQIQPVAAYVPYMTCPGNHEEA
jgi:hypothetical protein